MITQEDINEEMRRLIAEQIVWEGLGVPPGENPEDYINHGHWADMPNPPKVPLSED